MANFQIKTEIGVFVWFYLSSFQPMAEIDVFFWHIQPKKEIQQYVDFSHRLGKLASNLKVNITKMGKMLKFKKFMITFTWKNKIEK